MGLFRKKPVVVEAIYFHGRDNQNFMDVAAFFGGAPHRVVFGGIDIETLEGTIRASHGDWIIKGVKGEFYPCKPDIFDATYEAAEKP